MTTEMGVLRFKTNETVWLRILEVIRREKGRADFQVELEDGSRPAHAARGQLADLMLELVDANQMLMMITRSGEGQDTVYTVEPLDGVGVLNWAAAMARARGEPSPASLVPKPVSPAPEPFCLDTAGRTIEVIRIIDELEGGGFRAELVDHSMGGFFWWEPPTGQLCRVLAENVDAGCYEFQLTLFDTKRIECTPSPDAVVRHISHACKHELKLAYRGDVFVRVLPDANPHFGRRGYSLYVDFAGNCRTHYKQTSLHVSVGANYESIKVIASRLVDAVKQRARIPTEDTDATFFSHSGIIRRRWFKQIFMGSGEFSEAKCYQLHRLLDEVFDELGGLQQPGHPESDEAAAAELEMIIEGEAGVRFRVRDLVKALTGCEIKYLDGERQVQPGQDLIDVRREVQARR